jgi:predicted PurR-regulated permease PerM
MQFELTQIPISPRTRNVLVALATAALLLVFWKAPTLPKLLLTGGAVALILSFPVRFLSHYIPRGIAIGLVVLTLLALIVLGAIVLVPLAVGQIVSLAEQAPALLNEGYRFAHQVVERLADRGLIEGTPDEAMAQLQQTGATRVEGILQGLVEWAFNTLSGTIAGVFTTLSTILIAAYLLADGERLKSGVIRLLPRRYRDDAEVLWVDVGDALSRYLGGLIVSLTFQGITSTVILLVLGVPYAILLGIWTTFGAIIPYIGSYIGGIPSTIVAFTVSPTTGILTALGYVLINFIDGNLIAPRVQGQAIRVAPLFIFLAVIAGGQMAGIWGALMAVPILAVVRVVIGFLQERVVVQEPPTEPIPVALVEMAPEASSAPPSLAGGPPPLRRPGTVSAGSMHQHGGSDRG